MSAQPPTDAGYHPLSELAQLHGRALKSLQENLSPGEEVRVVILGPKGQAMAGTDTRVFVLKVGWLAGATLGSEVTAWNYRNLTGVQLHKGMLTGAVILQGPGQPGTSTSYWGQGNADPYKAPNAIPIAGHWDQVRSRVAILRSLIDRAQAGDASASSTSLTDELQKLADLRAQGILSDDEFGAAKRRVLAGNDA